MKTLKPVSVSVLHRTVEHGRRFHFTVTGALFLDLADPARLLTEVDLWKTVPGELGEGAVFDDAMPKSRGEVLVTGSAHPPGGAPAAACEVRVRVASVDKTLRVIGDRAWDARGAASAPAPFTAMPLRYTHAFGGGGFPLNPTGKGYGAEGGAPRPLPNVEDPRWPLRAPDQTVAPAGFGPYEFTWPQRASKLGTYDARWVREDMPGFARDIDWTVFNTAPDDQWLDGYFRGDEGFVLENLHPERARIEGRLPGLVVRAFINRRAPDGERFEEIPTRLDTVHFFPGALRAALLYRGVVEVAEDDAADVLQLLVGCERAGEPKDEAHYRRVLAQRMDRAYGALHALREGDLMPAGLAVDLTAPAGPAAPENVLAQRLRRAAELKLEQMREALAKRGIDPDQHLPKALPEPEGSPPLEEIPAAIERARAEAEARKAEVEAKRAEAEARARAKCAAAGFDYDALVKRPGGAQGGPPPSVRERVAAIRARVEAVKGEGLDVSAVERALGDPALHERLAAADHQQIDAYRKSAHLMPAAAPHDAETNARARATVERRYRSGEGFARWDLTGCDLAGMHLAGADFREALMEGVKLAGATLDGADFSEALMECVDLAGSTLDGADFAGATLVRANLTGATLSGARFTGANLGGATLADARATERVDFTGATLWRTDFVGASLTGATLDGVTVFEGSLARAQLRGASARKAMFLRSDLAEVSLPEASLQGATFLECTVTGGDFTGARMKGATFVKASGDGATFRGADLENLRVVHESSFERADFQEVRMRGATLRGTRLAGARFARSTLDESDFSECDLAGADLFACSARESRFVRAVLTGANLASAGLLGAILQKAVLTEADLSRAVLFGADMARTRGRPRSLEGADLERVRVLGERA